MMQKKSILSLCNKVLISLGGLCLIGCANSSSGTKLKSTVVKCPPPKTNTENDETSLQSRGSEDKKEDADIDRFVFIEDYGGRINYTFLVD